MNRNIPYFLLVLCCIIACRSPQKALENGNYQRSIKLSSKAIQKGKSIDENKIILVNASNLEVEKTLAANNSFTSSENVDNWIKAQSKYYKSLKIIGAANRITNGSANEPYDKLCERKIDLDFSIAEHFHINGDELIAVSRNTGKTKYAREAYDEYEACIKNGGEAFYKDIEDLKEECIDLGTVYYKAYDGAGGYGNRFLKPLPKDADWPADCIISVDWGRVNSSENRTESEVTYKKRIKVGESVTTDTSGVKTYHPIYETACAYKTTTRVRITLSSRTRRNVQNVTGECFLRSKTICEEVSDTYTEVRYSGDSRALPSCPRNKTGEPSFFRSNLERKLERKIDNQL